MYLSVVAPINNVDDCKNPRVFALTETWEYECSNRVTGQGQEVEAQLC